MTPEALIAAISALYDKYKTSVAQGVDEAQALSAYEAEFAQYRQPLMDMITAQQIPIESASQILNIMSPNAINNALVSRDAKEFAKRQKEAFGMLEGVVDTTQLINSFNQIRTAQEAAKATPVPAMPEVPGQNQQLSQELYAAQQRAGDIGYAINPAVQQLQQGYQQAVQQAQAASGGQASNLQALSNLANQQRMQAALSLVPAAQQARMQNQDVVNQLLGQQMQEQQAQFQNQMAQFPYTYDRWTRTQDAIAALGSQGRTYAMDALSRLPDYLQYLSFDDTSNSYIRDSFVEARKRELNAMRQPIPSTMNQPRAGGNTFGTRRGNRPPAWGESQNATSAFPMNLNSFVD